MKRAFLIWRERCRPIVHRLDRAAELINPLLLIVVVMLTLIDVSCFTALHVAQQHPREMTTTAIQ